MSRESLYQEAIAILAQTCAAEMGEPSVWRGLVKNAVEQARENIERDNAQLGRLQQYELITRVGFKEPGVDMLASWQVGRTSK